jgi:hypothetical protein
MIGYLKWWFNGLRLTDFRIGETILLEVQVTRVEVDTLHVRFYCADHWDSGYKTAKIDRLDNRLKPLDYTFVSVKIVAMQHQRLVVKLEDLVEELYPRFATKKPGEGVVNERV